MPRVELNSPAPQFEMEDHLGNLFRMKDFKGMNILLVFNRGFL